MNPKTAVAALLLMAPVALARGLSFHELSLEVSGWTPDGATFAFMHCSEAESTCGGTLWEARTGRIRAIDDVAFREWASKRNLPDKAATSRTSPDGHARAEVRAQAQKGAGVWKGALWTPASADLLALAIEREGKNSTVATLSVLAYAVDVYWAPDGRRVAWVVQTSKYNPQMGTASYEVRVTSAGTRVQLLADKSILDRVAPPTAQALESAGFAPTFVGRANEKREHSVIYFAAGFEDAARKAAAAVPGGATTEKLSWATEADLVVAAGASALKGKP